MDLIHHTSELAGDLTIRMTAFLAADLIHRMSKLMGVSMMGQGRASITPHDEAHFVPNSIGVSPKPPALNIKSRQMIIPTLVYKRQTPALGGTCPFQRVNGVASCHDKNGER